MRGSISRLGPVRLGPETSWKIASYQIRAANTLRAFSFGVREDWIMEWELC